MHESQMHAANCFVTLTYDDKHLPKDRSLVVKDWQDFAKRVRKNVGKFRFLHCGEYGAKFKRPHVHACMFGVDFRGDRKIWQENSGNVLFVSEMLQELWPSGFSTIGQVTFDSAAYVASYCTKKATGAMDHRNWRMSPVTGQVWRVKPEYATMSRRPGLGATFFHKYVDDIYPDDFCLVKGRKVPVPRFYDSLLEESNPELLEEVRRKRVERAREESPERLDVIDKIAKKDFEFYNGKKFDFDTNFASYVDSM